MGNAQIKLNKQIKKEKEKEKEKKPPIVLFFK
jgi:hypothetical protein